MYTGESRVENNGMGLLYSGVGQVYYDHKRPNGRYYLKIKLHGREDFASEDVEERELEIVLNGAGKNKARRKAFNQFRSMGLKISSFNIENKVVEVK